MTVNFLNKYLTHINRMTIKLWPWSFLTLKLMSTKIMITDITAMNLSNINLMTNDDHWPFYCESFKHSPLTTINHTIMNLIMTFKSINLTITSMKLTALKTYDYVLYDYVPCKHEPSQHEPCLWLWYFLKYILSFHTRMCVVICVYHLFPCKCYCYWQVGLFRKHDSLQRGICIKAFIVLLMMQGTSTHQFLNNHK